MSYYCSGYCYCLACYNWKYNYNFTINVCAMHSETYSLFFKTSNRKKCSPFIEFDIDRVIYFKPEMKVCGCRTLSVLTTKWKNLGQFPFFSTLPYTYFSLNENYYYQHNLSKQCVSCFALHGLKVYFFIVTYKPFTTCLVIN